MSRNLKTTAAGLGRRLLDGLTLRRVGLIVLGAMICTFGIHNIHQQTGITEGGVMGLMLLIEHWLGVSPAFITPVLDLTCYLLAFKYLGGRFIKISVVSTLSVSLFYKLWEQFPLMLPDLSAHPLAAGPVLPVHRRGGAGAVPDLYPLPAHRLLPHHRHPVLFPDRPRAGLHLPPPRPGLGMSLSNQNGSFPQGKLPFLYLFQQGRLHHRKHIRREFCQRRSLIHVQHILVAFLIVLF